MILGGPAWRNRRGGAYSHFERSGGGTIDNEQLAQLEGRLWGAADELRANSKLKASEYARPVLGLIFLRYADIRFRQAQAELKGQATGRRVIGPKDYQAAGVMYLPEAAGFAHLRQLPESAGFGKALNDAMKSIEEHNDDLKAVLPIVRHHHER